MDDVLVAKQICRHIRELLWDKFSYITNSHPDIEFSLIDKSLVLRKITYTAEGIFPDKLIVKDGSVKLVLNDGRTHVFQKLCWSRDVLDLGKEHFENLPCDIESAVKDAQKAYAEKYPKQKPHKK